MANSLKVGDLAPEIALLADDGTPFSLRSLQGREVVLYFYPKSDTPGCTTEACEFRDSSAPIGGKNALVVGVSPDTEKAQAKFKKKYGLNFVLLADSEHAAADAYGVWKEKSMYGKTYMGVERTTVVIGKDGTIKKVFPNVKVDGHVEEVLAALD